MKPFSYIYINGLLVLLLVSIIAVTVIKYLDIYTLHGKDVEIPNVTGLQVKEIEDIFKKKNYITV